MNSKNEVFEYLIDQLRRQLPVVDVMGEIKRWSIDRCIAGRGNYTEEENAIIDAYIGLEHNPHKQQCEDLAHEVLSLKNQLRDASALVAELQKELEILGCEYRRALDYALSDAPEQSGCRKLDVQEAELNACQHTNTVGLRKGFAPGFTKKCLDCGAKLK